MAWHRLTPAARARLPARARGWIALETSMVERIARRTGAAVAVEVLRQGTGRLLADEAPLLRPAAGPTLLREICLTAGGRPVLVARTAVLSRRLQAHPTLRGLGTRPLGSLLFEGGRPGPQGPREFARIAAGSPLWRLARRCDPSGPRAYWARRTLFRLFGEPLLVTEILLPPLLRDPPR
jgi:chorismate--pyruvate lyase